MDASRDEPDVCVETVSLSCNCGVAVVDNVCVRGSYSARVPRSSLARVHREFVHHIVEDEVDGQEEGQDDKRENGEQREKVE